MSTTEIASSIPSGFFAVEKGQHKNKAVHAVKRPEAVITKNDNLYLPAQCCAHLGAKVQLAYCPSLGQILVLPANEGKDAYALRSHATTTRKTVYARNLIRLSGENLRGRRYRAVKRHEGGVLLTPIKKTQISA